MKRIKELFIVIGTALSAWLGILYVPALILFACNIIDYVTGICAAGYRKENVSSYRSFRGIAKKICMWLLIAVGAMLDILLEYAAENVGISLGGEVYCRLAGGGVADRKRGHIHTGEYT